MRWRFTLYNRNNQPTEIEEPAGWKEFSIKVKRHPQRHGTFREVQQNNFQFHGKAAKLLREEYQLQGARGFYNLVIKGRTRYGFEQFYSGQLDFTTYKAVYDKNYYVEMDADQIGPLIKIVNRWEQPVDLIKGFSFDGEPLADYPHLDWQMMLPSKGILLRSEAYNTVVAPLTTSSYDVAFDANYSIAANAATKGFIIPRFDNTTLSEITDFKPSYAFDYISYPGDLNDAINTSEILQSKPDSSLVNENTFNFSIKYRGGFDVVYSQAAGTNGSFNIKLSVILRYGNNKTEILNTLIDQYAVVTPSGANNTRHTNISFDWNGSINLKRDEKFWMIFHLDTNNSSSGGGSPIKQLIIYSTVDSFFKVNSTTKSFPSPAKVFLINEAVSRVIESITDNQLRLYSEYFGRTNSAPYSFATDGCGGNRTLTNGLRIRQATLPDGGQAGMFLSLKDVFESLSATDNIGLGIEGNNIRIEPWKWFYKDTVIHRCKDIARIERPAEPSEIYSTFKFGYEKWEAEDSNGLDDFFTKREYRLDIPGVKNTLEQISNFIVSGYSIEVTRRKGQESADWRYDNDIFMICVEPNGGFYRVEVNNIGNAANIVDPSTVYNFRLTPIRNAMRWFNRIIGSYRNVDTGHKIIFASGEGNYIAEGNLISLTCKLEAGVLLENQDLTLTAFADQEDGLPIMWPERVKFSYPLGTSAYQAISANPYGLIEFTSPTENGFGWIDEITYRPNEGKADFVLIPKID